jgi:hypothetical protein
MQKMFICACGKEYKWRSGLSYHKPRCKFLQKILTYVDENKEEKQIEIGCKDINYDNTQMQTQNDESCMSNNNISNIQNISEENESGTTSNDIKKLTSLVTTLINENKELQNMLIEQNNKMFELAKQPKTINTQNNINILNYLNTECKDALDLTEFIKQINITFEELLNIPYQGGVINSFKNNFVKQLKDLEYKKRPIHCSDKKRKKFYVKDEGQWEKDEENKKIQRAIHNVANRHYSTFQNWKEENPDWLDDETKQEQANKITISLCDIYNDREKQKIVTELAELSSIPPSKLNTNM